MQRPDSLPILSRAALAAVLLAGSAAAQCGAWSDEFRPTAFDGALEHGVVFDDGSGSTLYVLGTFQHAPGGVPASRIARRTSTGWSSVGSLPAGTIRGLTVFDDGSGARLHAFGRFPVGASQQGGVFVWNGSQWNQLGGYFPIQTAFNYTSQVAALAVFNDGTGPRLYAGGDFPRCVSRWNGSAWTTYATGFSNGIFDDAARVDALVVHAGALDSAPTLYAGGSMNRIGDDGGTQDIFGSVARVSAGTWISAANNGLGGVDTNNRVEALAGFPTPIGPRIVAGGSFPSGTLAMSSGNGSWASFVPGTSWRNIEAFDASSGVPAGLWVTGNFTQIGGVAAAGRARYDGSWHALGGAGVSSTVNDFVAWDDGSGSGVRPFALTGNGILEVLDAGVWSVWDLMSPSADGPVRSLASVRSADGATELFAHGEFTVLGGIVTGNCARYDGASWSALPLGGAHGEVRLHAVDLGAGDELYATGSFSGYGATDVNVLRRSAETWAALPLIPLSHPARPHTLAAFDDGGGMRLHASGGSSLWRLDGLAWTAVVDVAGGSISSIVSFDDGAGPALFLACVVPSSTSGYIHGAVARWDGLTLDPQLGSMPDFQFPQVLATHDEGAGPRLFAGGNFLTVGGVAARGIARWDGGAWSAVGSGVFGSSSTVYRLAVHDEGLGSGPELVMAGGFTSVDGVAVSRIARWDGVSWDSLDGGVGAQNLSSAYTFGVSDLAVFDAGDGRGPDLFVGGAFTTAGTVSSPWLARRRACGGDATTFCYGDGSATACPCGNSSAAGSNSGCLHSLGAGGTLRAHGRASISNDSLVIEGASMPNSSALYFQGANLANGGFGVPFGDGIKCTAGPFVRLGTKTNSLGASAYPTSGDLSVSIKGFVGAPGTRRYQVRYRNSAAFCSSETFNYTNGLTVLWGG